MGIKIKRATGGGYRPWWYGTYKENGKTKDIRLDVKVSGNPPASLSAKDTGSIDFEKSKAKALAAFDKFLQEHQRKGAADAIMERLIESRTGTKVSYIRLGELSERWNQIPRTQEISEGRKKENAFIFNEFARHCNKRTYLYEVTADDVSRYFNAIRGSYAWSTVESRMSLLSGAFARFLPTGMSNPFKCSVIKRDTSKDATTIHHAPLSNEELQKVRDVARQDPFLYPLVECAISTGMRLKDIANLRWESIDLKDGFITYNAMKTGSFCEVPLFPGLRAVFEGLLIEKDPNEPLVFPDAARMYEHNRSGLVRRGKVLFAKALFGDRKKGEDVTLVENGEPILNKTPDEIIAALDHAAIGPAKCSRMKTIFDRYAILKQSYRQIENETGIARSTISDLLKEVEEMVGQKVIRFNPTDLAMRDRIKLTRLTRSGGKKSVALYGWHSFRATFCVQAINAGVPESEIIKAIGHSTFKTTMKYYNNPTRSVTRELWKQRMSTTSIGMATPAQPKLLEAVA